MASLIEKALAVDRESKYIEFKSMFDAVSNQDWCEVIKDIVALSNSGGGVIIFGLESDGSPSGSDVSIIADLDPADLTNKIVKYTGEQFSGLNVSRQQKNGAQIVAMEIEGSRIPIVFRKPGTYALDNDKQKTAFKEGAVYFRHGAKSAPGNSSDLRRALEKELDRVKKSWLSDIGKVVKAPADSEVIVVSQDARRSAGGAAAMVRLTTDPNAPTVGQLDPDVTHPYRQKELIEKIRERLPEGVLFNSYDATSIWYAHDIAEHPEFFYDSKFGTTQYSDAYVDWIMNSYTEDNNFFGNSRERHYEIKHP